MEEILLLNSENILIGLSKQAQSKEYQFDRIYRNLYIPDMYIKAYNNILVFKPFIKNEHDSPSYGI